MQKHVNFAYEHCFNVHEYSFKIKPENQNVTFDLGLLHNSYIKFEFTIASI